MELKCAYWLVACALFNSFKSHLYGIEIKRLGGVAIGTLNV